MEVAGLCRTIPNQPILDYKEQREGQGSGPSNRILFLAEEIKLANAKAQADQRKKYFRASNSLGGKNLSKLGMRLGRVLSRI